MSISKLLSPVTPNNIINKTNEIIDALGSSSSASYPIYPVKGTQVSATNVWTGTIDVPALYDGLTIAYYLPYKNNNPVPVFLNLTLNDNTTTGNIPCYRNDGLIYSNAGYPAGSTIILTYWSAGSISISGTATTAARWITADQDTTYSNATTATPGLLSNADKRKINNLTTATASTTAYGYMSAEDKIALNGLSEIGEIISNASTVDISVPNSSYTTLTSVVLPAGVWMIAARGHFNTSTAGVRRLFLSETSDGEGWDISCPGGNAQLKYEVNRIVNLASQTTYYLRAWQNSGNALTSSLGRSSIEAVRIK